MFVFIISSCQFNSIFFMMIGTEEDCGTLKRSGTLPKVFLTEKQAYLLDPSNGLDSALRYRV